MFNEFLLLAVAHLFAVASPGADFAVVIKNTLNSGRRAGFYTALGIGLGILVHVGYTLFGVALLVSQSPQLFTAVKYLGAFYLVWLAFKCFQSRKTPSFELTEKSFNQLTPSKAFKQGFIVNVLNPKVTVFFVALFTSIVSQQTPLWTQTFYGVWLSLYTILWFMLVAWLFSRPHVLLWYQQHGHIIDWLMGVVLILIAVRLIL